MSLDELKRTEKKLNFQQGFYKGVIIVLLIVCLFLTVNQGLTVTTLPIAFLPIFIAGFSGLKQITNKIIPGPLGLQAG